MVQASGVDFGISDLGDDVNYYYVCGLNINSMIGPKLHINDNIKYVLTIGRSVFNSASSSKSPFRYLHKIITSSSERPYLFIVFVEVLLATLRRIDSSSIRF
jgi:hypothetical protein